MPPPRPLSSSHLNSYRPNLQNCTRCRHFQPAAFYNHGNKAFKTCADCLERQATRRRCITRPPVVAAAAEIPAPLHVALNADLHLPDAPAPETTPLDAPAEPEIEIQPSSLLPTAAAAMTDPHAAPEPEILAIDAPEDDAPVPNPHTIARRTRAPRVPAVFIGSYNRCKEHYTGKMDIICCHCKALHWLDEHMSTSSKQILSSLCAATTVMSGFLISRNLHPFTTGCLQLTTIPRSRA